MAKKSQGTGRNPLKLAEEVSYEVNKAFEDGSLYEQVSPITQDLLRYWFSPSFCDSRDINFHQGQKQAILNIIYLHEVVGIKNVKDLYLNTDSEILQDMDIESLEQYKYQHPMYAVKMATGTGKTWVMHALLIWQYLNASNKFINGNYSKNFLIVTPGLIVYNRILDAFLGKENEDGVRDFETSDFVRFKKLFIPKPYEQKIFGFLQSCVVRKEEISHKVTGDGLIAIANWHILQGDKEEKEFISPLDAPHQVLSNILPVTPGKTSGNDLQMLDDNFLAGGEIGFLSELENLVVFNDEAHHIHSFKRGGEVFEVEWQKSLNEISKTKGDGFIQVDFSATPYISTTGKNKVRHYFPHIIVDFDLKTAIHKGLVKLIAIDKRKEIASLDLDFKAERDENNNIIGLSDGQRLMLRAGLTKLKILGEEFSKLGHKKHPKMLVICEDTNVAPFVSKFFINEGLSDEEIVEIHSKKKAIEKEKDWNEIKQKLFNIDEYENPKIIISVLMLREGFDVNNICVIVPLRSTESDILLEQTIGRGLRLMWREPDYFEIKDESRKRILIEKREPTNYLDLLSIIEHPKFMDYYEQQIESDLVVEVTDEPTSGRVLGDMMTVTLREDYEKYDFYWPLIIREREEILKDIMLSVDELEVFPTPLKDLQVIKGKGGEKFRSQELTMKTKFGEYRVSADIFTVDSYNEFLSKIISNVNSMIQPMGRKNKIFPMMQINNAELAELIDKYIRNRLFDEPFDPMIDENWRILVMSENSVVNHIIKQISKAIYEMQTNVDIKEAIVNKYYFSSIKQLRMRENFAIPVTKSIYEYLPYPSNKGGLEKAFIEALDEDGEVASFLKINEYYHTFASITYVRDDGLLARYYPDFIVKIRDDIFIVETKADKDIKSPNVQKKRISTLDTLEKINELNPEDRMNSTWKYALLRENTFYSMLDNGASIKDILEYTIVTEDKARGFKTLDNF